ncbi:hypothetical protein G7K_1971-t1 [Saitoella complicata NRRL Y-17804]|uniref:RWD domain-containing protein n=1 Tax=Saitoella complicata (strain BCRC 22490 / CBS 7301 / JCM 7358 / NBRC 10748 / NRRL Y-17804) TaxID=698492 RepID=A0A0E9ND90_SAICN|nr:hypothetical protein G7K_1971-t1 [Saitoella complicata NRRL Y-17804]
MGHGLDQSSSSIHADAATKESPFNSPTFGRQMTIEVPEPVGSLSISPSGRDVVLASRKGLLIIDLDNPYDPPRYLHHLTTWEVADVQWNPHAARDYWVVSTSNQKAMVWNLAMPSRRAIEHVLHGHTRAITDINFSAHHPDILATCAIDSYVHCWDMRDARRPVNSFSDWRAGATQVKWSRQNDHILASSHDRFLHVWDDRKGATPLRTIEAHDAKIYGIDFNRVKESKIITCSLDKTVKFWDFNDPSNEPEKVMRTDTPIWRARHTPFGWGLGLMPQRGDNNLYLYDREFEKDEPVRMVHTFEGHNDQVKEFLWRARGAENPNVDDRDFQLVTWSKDQTLRLWPVSDEVLKSVGHTKDKPIRFHLTRYGSKYRTFSKEPEVANKEGPAVFAPTFAPAFSNVRGSTGRSQTAFYKQRSQLGQGGGGFMTTHKGGQGKKEVTPLMWMRGVRMGKSTASGPGPFGWDGPENLGEELSGIGQKFPKVNFEKINVAGRVATIALHVGAPPNPTFMRMNVQFPEEYPVTASPTFEFERNAAIHGEKLDEMLQALNKIATIHVERGRPCVEAVIRYLLGEVQDEEDWKFDADESDSDDEVTFAGQEDERQKMHIQQSQNVPLPKKCAAIFTGNGKLVCFFPNKQESKITLLSTLTGEGSKTEEKGHQRYFETFGRLSTGPVVGTTTRHASLASEGSAGSGDDSDAESSSTGTDDSLLIRPVMPSWKIDTSLERLSQRRLGTSLISGDSAHRSATIKTGNRKNVVSIHDFSHIMPVNEKLAQGYVMTGPRLCQHNARIARTQGRKDLEEVWLLAEMLLNSGVPLEIIEPDDGASRPILVVARKASALFKRKDSGLSVSDEDAEPKQHIDLYGRVRWGNHPMGRSLVDEIFSHFEKLGDIQTLAMLSCVFKEPKRKRPPPIQLLRRNPPRSSTQPATPAINLEYFPSVDYFSVSHHHPYPPEESPHPLGTTTTTSPLAVYGSYESSRGSSFTGPTDAFPKLFRGGNGTPPTPGLAPWHINPMEEVAAASLMGTSPKREQVVRNHSRSSTGANQSQLGVALKNLQPGSPPNSKKPSPSSGTSGFGVTWGPVTRITASASGSERDEPSHTGNPHVTVIMMNMGEFDDERHQRHVPLVSPDKPVRLWREEYAEFLYQWGLLEARLELLKFNRHGTVAGEVDPELTFQEVKKNSGLGLGVCCTMCGAGLGPDEIRCHVCQHIRSQPKCALCEIPVNGLGVFCLECSHGGHATCMRSWFADGGEERCAMGMGCECKCQDHVNEKSEQGRLEAVRNEVTTDRKVSTGSTRLQSLWQNTRSVAFGTFR